MKIVKHSGLIVDFNPDKLKNSLTKSGASASVIDDIMKKIQNEIYEGISTKKIYKMAFALLKKKANSHAARYNLREAIRLLGPAGFFFEKYTARLFASEGYATLMNMILFGKCVSHELDVLVKKNDVISMIECKFHMGRDLASDVKVPMYILSRFNDLKDRKHLIFTEKDQTNKTNVEFIKIENEANFSKKVLQKIYEHNIHSVLIEGGAGILNCFIEAGLWDEANIEVSPQCIGDGIKAPQINALPVSKLSIESHDWLFFKNNK